MYEVVVIESSGPGRTLASFDSDQEAREYIEDTGVAHEYSWGVAILDAETGLYDFDGNGEFEPWAND